MKTIENHYDGNWLDRMLNSWPFLIHKDAVATFFTFALDDEGLYRPDSVSLFYNGYLMIRITLPLGVWLHIKPLKQVRFQAGAGWKLNGRFGLIFRLQTDAEAAAGVHGPNVGQATYWNRGTA